MFYSIDCKDAMEELKRYVEEEIFTEDFITKEDIAEYTLALHNIQYMKTVMDQYRINACCIREEDLYFN